MYIYICILIFIFIHIYVHIYTHTYIHVYIHIYVYIYIHTYIHIYIRIYIHIYTCTCIHTHTHICIYKYIDITPVHGRVTSFQNVTDRSTRRAFNDMDQKHHTHGHIENKGVDGVRPFAVFVFIKRQRQRERVRDPQKSALYSLYTTITVNKRSTLLLLDMKDQLSHHFSQTLSLYRCSKISCLLTLYKQNQLSTNFTQTKSAPYSLYTKTISFLLTLNTLSLYTKNKFSHHFTQPLTSKNQFSYQLTQTFST